MFACILLSLPSACTSVDVACTGIVQAAGSGIALPYANVTLKGAGTSSVLTDTNGECIGASYRSSSSLQALKDALLARCFHVTDHHQFHAEERPALHPRTHDGSINHQPTIGKFTFPASTFNSSAMNGNASRASTCTVSVWARQYLAVNETEVAPGGTIAMQPRPIPGFPASDWKFEGWPIQAQTEDVPGTGIAFLAHPSAYRPPTGDRIFLTSTANRHAGPGWTQGYWKGAGVAAATAQQSH